MVLKVVKSDDGAYRIVDEKGTVVAVVLDPVMASLFAAAPLMRAAIVRIIDECPAQHHTERGHYARLDGLNAVMKADAKL